MRQRIAEKQKHKARGVSLPPEMDKAASIKSSRLDMSFSAYVQKLIENDLRNNVIGKVLAEQALKAA